MSNWVDTFEISVEVDRKYGEDVYRTLESSSYRFPFSLRYETSGLCTVNFIQPIEGVDLSSEFESFELWLVSHGWLPL
jgi:hypothetical protein